MNNNDELMQNIMHRISYVVEMHEYLEVNSKPSQSDLIEYLQEYLTIMLRLSIKKSSENLKLLSEKYPDVDFVQGNILDERASISSYGWHAQLPEYCDNHEKLEKYIFFMVVTSAWNKLLKTSFLIEHKLFFPEGIIHEDMYWIFFLTKHTKAVSFVNKGTYSYYINPNSIITSIDPNVRIKRYSSRLYASEAFFADIDKEKSISRNRRLFIAGNLTSAMIEVAALHSLKHWHIFWQHVWKLYASHKKLTFWQHIFFLFLMPPLCFPIGIKGWYWRVQKYIVNKI